MRTSIATVSISGTLFEKLEAIAAAGFDGIEIFETDFLTFGATPREVGGMIRDTGLEITLFQPFRDFEGLPEPLRSRAFERARRKFEVMNELGTDLMLICSNVSPEALGGVDRAAADLRELGELAGSMGIRVGYEALAWGRHVNEVDAAWSLVEEADFPNLGLAVDSYHIFATSTPLSVLDDVDPEKIFLVQLADFMWQETRTPEERMETARHFRVFPGEGVHSQALATLVRRLDAIGYRGDYSFEVFNDDYQQLPLPYVAERAHASALWLAEEVLRRGVPLPGMARPPRQRAAA